MRTRTYFMAFLIVITICVGSYAFFSGTTSIEKKEPMKKSARERATAEPARKIQDISQINDGKSLKNYLQEIRKLSDEELMSEADSIIEADGNMNEKKDRLALILGELIRRQSGLAKNLMEKLPAGTISEDIVRMAVTRFDYGGTQDIETIAGIVTLERFRSIALESAWRRISMLSLANRIKQPISYDDIRSVMESDAIRDKRVAYDLYVVASKQKSVGESDAVELFKNVRSKDLEVFLSSLSKEGAISLIAERLASKNEPDNDEDMVLAQVSARLVDGNLSDNLQAISVLPRFAADKVTANIFKMMIKRDPDSLEKFILESQGNRSRDLAIREMIASSKGKGDKYSDFRNLVLDEDIKQEIEEIQQNQ